MADESLKSFEVIEMIRFFGQLVSTEGIAEEVKQLANDYMIRLLRSMDRTISNTTAGAVGLKIVKS